MEKINIKRIGFLSVTICLSVCMKAVPVRVVYDVRCVAAVSNNIAYQGAMETEHNKVLDDIEHKHKQITKYISSMESIKELYRISMQNIKGFGEESAYYRQILENLVQIPHNTAEAVKEIKKNPGINYVNSLNEIVNIQAEVLGLAKLFSNIVNNGKIKIPKLSGLGNIDDSQNDGYNFMDRYQRLEMANDILTHLIEINTRLQQIKAICEFCCTFSNLLYSIDPLTWASYFEGATIVEDIVGSWKYQMET